MPNQLLSLIDGQYAHLMDKYDKEQIVDIDKPFKNADGDEALYPGGFGIASEDINCRCCVVQRAKWNLNNKFTKMNGETNKLMEFKNKEDYDKFKAEFWKWSENQ